MGLSAPSARAQEAMRVAIPLFPTAAFPVLVARPRLLSQRRTRRRADQNQQRADHLPSADLRRCASRRGRADRLTSQPLTRSGCHCPRQLGQPGTVRLGNAGKNRRHSELRGKKISVNRAGSKPSLVIHVLLQDAGLDPAKDLTLLQMGGGSQERVGALIAAASTPPSPTCSSNRS